MYPVLQSEVIRQPKKPSIDRPKIAGFFSLDGNEETFRPDASHLKFIKTVPEGRVLYDLNKQIEAVIHKENHENALTLKILNFLAFEKRVRNVRIVGKNNLKDAKFVCNRGALTNVAISPYTKSCGHYFVGDTWTVKVTLHKGVIYMSSRDKERNMASQHTRFSSWGYKFEQYIVSDDPETDPTPNKPCDERPAFYLVLSSKLNGHDLFYTSEVDGMGVSGEPLPKEEGYDAMLHYLQQQKFFEIKTKKRPETQRQETNFKKNKALKVWCQSSLGGIEKVICGLRDDDGIVDEVKIYNVKSMPDECKNFWDSNACLNFLDTFLSHVKKCLSQRIISKYGENALNELDSLEPITLHFERASGGAITTRDIEISDIIPDWFIEEY